MIKRTYPQGFVDVWPIKSYISKFSWSCQWKI